MSTTHSEWNSFIQLIQELVTGIVHRSRFTKWEVNLVLEVQTAGLRKAARGDALRPYSRFVQQSLLNGAAEPPSFLAFLAETQPRKAAAGGGSE